MNRSLQNGVSSDEDTSLAQFFDKSTVADILLAAKTAKKLGYVPELRFVDDCNGPASVELYVKDIPSLIGALRASLDATGRTS